ncbi:hypothetical protein DOTSEDRAFT_33421 [Dothistroma septosporum NZE10]|uniref:SprT-like domain-containing protein n=1 Tax=Dothistroma septosporum (strain NZE10 / CBS 128990) TaxID=675120 RepID=N1PTW6_DOTSN|nr:hypothetical protein DOTSEDRAFT_33421 [Dothistroma septosporum NZE10]
MFFLGRLSRCRFDWQEDLLNEEDVYGKNVFPDMGSRNWAALHIDPDVSYYQDLGLRDNTIMTILHECAHAFLRIWICDDSKCKTVKCKDVHAMGIGGRGHGYLWLQLTSHVYAVAHNFLGINTVDAAEDLRDSMYNEWQATGNVPGWRHVRGCHWRYRFRVVAFIREYKDRPWVSPRINDEEDAR